MDHEQESQLRRGLGIPADAERVIVFAKSSHWKLNRARTSGFGCSPARASLLRATLEPGTVPLLYPLHFAAHRVQWPRYQVRRANALALHADTRKWLYPSGFYVVVRRLSAKEEKRRIVASVVDPGRLPGPWIAFENHLNVLHSNAGGLDEELAYGLMAYLNSTVVDQYFRRFSGHTQVNAADLRALPYACRNTLEELGRWAKAQTELSQDVIDHQVRTTTGATATPPARVINLSRLARCGEVCSSTGFCSDGPKPPICQAW